MSSRPITEDDLNGFVDQRLSLERQAEVTDYLNAHPDVARRISFYHEQREGLRAALGPIVNEPIPTELNLSRIIEDQRRPRLAPYWRSIAAVIALLCVGGVAGWILRSFNPPKLHGISALVQEARTSYAVYAPDQLRPVEIRAHDLDALASWAEKRVGRSIVAPDLAESGYSLMGGRVVPTTHGPAALFMYTDERGTRLVMLVRPMRIENDAPMSPHSRGNLNTFAWADDGLGYSLVGAVSVKALEPLANNARRQLRKLS